jgi:hypothetical protein
LGWLVLRDVYNFQTTIDLDDDEEYELVSGSLLPQEPSALIVTDVKGDSKWTVSIPSSLDFPLRPAQYQEICSQSMELSKQLRSNKLTNRMMLGYYQQDKYFLDVGDAEDQGLLPPPKSSGRPKGFVDDASMVNHKAATDEMKVCDRTLTYVMETGEAGFGPTLLRLWMSYGLAKKENRTFFIDDTKWPYGKYSTYFAPPPAVDCLPPPKTQMVPCPHTARHLVISVATNRQAFGHSFSEEYEDPTKMEVQRQVKIFGLLRTGYEALFQLRADDAKYVTERTEALYGPNADSGNISIAMHVRRGDVHPMEFQYSKDYIPLDRYVDTAADIFTWFASADKKSKKSKNKQRHVDRSNTPDFAPSTLILASDDPDVYETSEMSQATRAQDRIVLATKKALEASSGKKNPWIDEVSGWEGGFYRDVFWSLGRPVGNALDVDHLDNSDAPETAMRLRELVGRAYLLDLAVVGKADAVICTVSSSACRILAVILGWESAINEGNWRNVDGEFDWRGVNW